MNIYGALSLVARDFWQVMKSIKGAPSSIKLTLFQIEVGDLKVQ